MNLLTIQTQARRVQLHVIQCIGIQHGSRRIAAGRIQIALPVASPFERYPDEI